MKACIFAPDYDTFDRAAGIAVRAGCSVSSLWHGFPEGLDTDHLSTRQMNEAADAIMPFVVSADVVVVVMRSSPLPRDDSPEFFAGAARARGIPVIEVGPFHGIGLYTSGVRYTDFASLGEALKKEVESIQGLRRLDQPFSLTQARRSSPSTPTGDTNDDSGATHDSEGPAVGRADGGEVGGAGSDGPIDGPVGG